MKPPPPSFRHILAMSDGLGTFEHAELEVPRVAHGYCTDDEARVLLVVAREPGPAPAVAELGRTAFRFLAEAQGPTGRVRNRRVVGGRWEDRPKVEDAWGRSLWALGTAARHAPEGWMRRSGLELFGHGVQQRPRWRRSMAFAALGAAEVLEVEPRHAGARALLADAAAVIGRPAADRAWPWPEPRLTYANAVLADALVACGALLAHPEVLEDGLSLLRWLLARETSAAGHLSPTPAGGAGPGDPRPRFDQQPIEVATMADACARAAVVTGDDRWLEGLSRCVRWFTGENDAGTPMWDERTGGGYDGLHATGPNRNQGAESTLALISTMQHARRLVLVA